MVVAFTIFYATGNRWRAIMWSAVSGLSEILGAVIGLSVVCGSSMSDIAFGIVFGLVGGLMVSVRHAHARLFLSRQALLC
jgi:ZIP family zinc transporter